MSQQSEDNIEKHMTLPKGRNFIGQLIDPQEFVGFSVSFRSNTGPRKGQGLLEFVGLKNVARAVEEIYSQKYV